VCSVAGCCSNRQAMGHQDALESVEGSEPENWTDELFRSTRKLRGAGEDSQRNLSLPTSIPKRGQRGRYQRESVQANLSSRGREADLSPAVGGIIEASVTRKLAGKILE